jgi:hypothetical protein
VESSPRAKRCIISISPAYQSIATGGRTFTAPPSADDCDMSYWFLGELDR